MGGGGPLGAGPGVVHLDAGVGHDVANAVGGLVGAVLAKPLAQGQQGIDQRSYDIVGVANARRRGLAEPDDKSAQDVACEVGAFVLLRVGRPLPDR